MTMQNPNTDMYVPQGGPFWETLAKTTHMAIAAHQDDIEIMAYDGILRCLGSPDKLFSGVVVTDGRGSARKGPYQSFSDEQMAETRRLEQRKAADIGHYGAMVQLGYPSMAVKDPDDLSIVSDLATLLEKARPDILYTHNLADKHDTHIGVTMKTIAAIRSLSKDIRPKKLYGCEVWRDLDWMVDSDKVVFDVSGKADLARQLVDVFDSQIAGGKRYDMATIGRRLAHATYHTSHETDTSDALTFAMDLTPLIINDTRDILTYVAAHIIRFQEDVVSRIRKHTASR
jgi:LmbE family N-acetylglucosaminyl deacetylase